MTGYVALLRGINVGGKNPIKMTELRACFEEQGFRDVSTYIQSGNVVFAAGATQVAELVHKIERMLAAGFDYEASVAVRSRTQMRAVVERAPVGFGADPSKYRSDVIFLKPPLTARAAMKGIRTREGVDQAYPGTGVLYYSRLTSRASQSQLSRIVGTPAYQSMTIRNWNTTTKLKQMVDALG
jgi:uncharacterized protein (DUF1697 family)